MHNEPHFTQSVSLSLASGADSGQGVVGLKAESFFCFRLLHIATEFAWCQYTR